MRSAGEIAFAVCSTDWEQDALYDLIMVCFPDHESPVEFLVGGQKVRGTIRWRLEDAYPEVV
ncbi:hypothetical protein [Tellurirhabdus bombi]|uniref:hypothetical protein n=1 Tax=Tellurirhabdus bombi TaxID=2907205 RepID=UPI001F397F39|nr:hypothetical protein [Tellurirhabdus bombi]